MNVSKIGVTQILPKTNNLYKVYGANEIRHRLLKDGSVAVAVYKEGKNISDRFMLLKKGTDINEPNVLKKCTYEKYIDFSKGEESITHSIDKIKLDPDGEPTPWGDLKQISYFCKELTYYKNKLLRKKTRGTKENGTSYIVEETTKFGQKKLGRFDQIRGMFVKNRHGEYDFTETKNSKSYSRKLAGSNVTRNTIYYKDGDIREFYDVEQVQNYDNPSYILDAIKETYKNEVK